ncbi:hypothetical protein Pla175_27790 [Pirellulimonas nuda]|uniref:PilZ domain-containing protein n=1 Tax=Pirellulimonas nuda TaxID=2528009 RepID=A0A518DD47_9BACT|nr:PilZ domain-containing protein [Pirellulimonas nuda]QDU89389.1 hypothetical protein Pla175_27790 [Pirellulimonas nuda]
MPGKETTQAYSEGLLDDLLLVAQAEFKSDRRTEQRYPFFRPASVQVGGHNFSAFTREISVSGVGLLHSMELPLSEVVIQIAGGARQLRLRIERCEPIGEGWYTGGGALLGGNA